jgi:hypothetical protein
MTLPPEYVPCRCTPPCVPEPEPAGSTREMWPIPANGTPQEAIKAGLKAARSLGTRPITTREETETGRALATWFVYHLDLWIASGALTADEAEVVDRYFRHDHPCEGSGGRVAPDVTRKALCVVCDQPVAVHPRRRRMVAHNRQYGNEDVARDMKRTLTWVKDTKRSAIDKMTARLYPDAPANP